MFDLAKLGALAAQAEKQNVVSEGGKKKELPVEGKTFMRLRDYIELGEHDKTGQYTGIDNKVLFTFELLSKNYLKDFGKGLEPQIISIYVNKSNFLKSDYVKLFSKLNYLGTAEHGVQLLGMPYIGKITHRKAANGEVYANLKENDTFNIEPPVLQDPMSGEVKQFEVPALHGQPNVFLFENPLLPDDEYLRQWHSLHREGTNWLQETIQKSKKFNGSRLQQLLNGSQQSFQQQVVTQLNQAPKVQQQSTVITQEVSQPVQVTGAINTVLGQFAPNQGQYNEDLPF